MTSPSKRGRKTTMLRLSNLATMTKTERAEALQRLTSEPNGVAVDAEIRRLERQYEMTSATMLDRVRRGEVDTADTARWLVLLQARGPAKRRSGPRGTDLSYAERNRDGGCSILLRLSAEDARMLDELRDARGEDRSASIRWAIRDAWEATQTARDG